MNNHTKMYVTYTRIYGWSDYGGESSYQPGYRLENMMWMTLLVYDYIIPGDKFISYNPMPETKPYPRAKPKVRVLSKEKLKVFLEAASKNPWYLEILLGLFCGLRKEFTVTEYAVIERNPKTENSYRILRAPKVVMREVKCRQQLMELRKNDPGIEYKDFDYVCCQENGETRSLTAMNQALTKICNRNGLPNITVHGLRHMFATILIELGVSLFKIFGLLGHSYVHTTYEYYCEIMDEQDKIIAFVNNTFVPQRTGTEE
ncbi:site-specific integrase [[Ruminococcus] lactaris]